MNTMMRYSAGVGMFCLIYAGIFCEEDVGVCEQQPCQNGGTCERHHSGFRCLCSQKTQNGRLYGGETCAVALSGCDDNRCENGGICSPLLVLDQQTYLCGCLAGFAGPRCQTPTTFSFQGNGGYLRVEAQAGRAPLRLTFSFRTRGPAGTLLQCRVDDLLLIVELLSGRLRLSSWRGQGSSVTLVQELQGHVSDGEWHAVEASLGAGVSWIRLLCAGCQSLFLGATGLNRGVGEEPPPAFRGCFRDVVMDSRLVLPRDPGPEVDTLQANVTMGCGDEDGCEVAPCGGRGRCVALGGRSYRCVCHRPYQGPDCHGEYVPARFGAETMESYAVFSLVDPPHTLASDEQPHTLASDEQPHTLAPDEQPHTLAPDKQPHTLAPDEQPHTLAPDQQPHTLAPDQQPHTLAPDEQPHTLAPDEQPHTLALDEQPHTLALDEQPHTLAPDEQPHTLAPDEQPHTLAPDEQPHTLASDEQPNTLASDEQPHTLALDEQPHTLAPDEQPHTLAPDEQPHTLALDEQPHTLAPDEQPHTLAPDEQPHTLAPDEQPHTLASDEQPHTLASDEQPHTLAVSMFVRTKRPSGLLMVLANSSSQYLRVWLEEGRVKVQVNNLESMTGQAMADDGHFHLLTVEVEGRVAVLTQASQIQASVTITQVQPRPGDRVFVGGLPDPGASAAFGGYFEGCVQDLRINGRTLQFFPLPSSAPGESHRLEQRVHVTRGCSSDDACAGKPCLHGGVCDPMGEDFSCSCPPSTAGRRCEEVRWCELSPCPSSAVCQPLPLGFQCLANVTLRGGASGGASGGGVLSYRGNGQITRRLTSLLLRLRTRQTDATVLQARQGSSLRLTVSLRRSHLAMELRGDGGAPAVSVQTAGPVTDGRWHAVKLRMVTPDAERSRWVVEEDGQSAEARVSDATGGSLDFLREGVDILLGGGDSGGGLDGCLGPLEIGGIPLPFHGDEELSLPQPQKEQFLLGGVTPPRPSPRWAEACSPNPCGNRGTCEKLLGLPRCRCPPGWTGRLCQRPDAACRSDPCLHGDCTASPALGAYECAYECACERGYVGSRCEVEVEVDTCSDHRCSSGATCLRGLDGYGCLCPRNTTGRYCSEKPPEIPWYVEIKPFPALPVAECAGGGWNYSCFHGGTCSGGDVICHCVAGFMGHWCEMDVDECASDPCMHGGICLDGPAGWECVCDQNFSGVHCQMDVSDFHLYLFLALWQNFFQLLSYQMWRLDDPEVEWAIQLDD